MAKQIEISVVVPVVERYDDIALLYSEFASALDSLGKSYEFIFVMGGGEFDNALEDLKKLQKEHSVIRILKLIKNFGESVALSIGVDKSQGNYIFTLASYFQVEADCMKTIWTELTSGYDLVITRRYPRVDSQFNRLQSYLFHWLIWQMTPVHFHDISCGLRGIKKEVFEEVKLYGDLHRFIPILADKYGYKIKEVKARQRREDTALRLVGLGAYPRRLLDILSLVFITKFTMKPLRFFGLIGASLFGCGSLITGALGLYRLLGIGGIGDKPMLLLGVLLMVLGIQTLSIGFIGEIIIYTHAKEIREYQVEEYLGIE